MQNFKFNIPTVIHFGSGELERIRTFIRSCGKKAFIVTGQASARKSGSLDKLIKYIDSTGISCAVFSGIEANPHNHTIDRAAGMFVEEKADMLVALGGGSVMDAAKSIAVSAKSGKGIWEFCRTRTKSALVVKDAFPVICIPTLSATGSEINGTAVVYNPDTRQKSVIHSPRIFPVHSIIDPALTCSVPFEYIVDGAIDIICHTSETYFSSVDEDKINDLLTMSVARTCACALDAIADNFESGHDVSESLPAREQLAWASSIAMSGILSGRKGGWPIHQIEHAVSGAYGVSHGFSLSKLFPAMLESILYVNGFKISRFAGFLLHENTSFYDNPETALKDIKMWLDGYYAGRRFPDVSPAEIAQRAIDINGNEEGYIYGIKPMYQADVKHVAELAFRK
jgi:alcohol dehydrogenase YqhD (iron-dependent ADH family)